MGFLRRLFARPADEADAPRPDGDRPDAAEDRTEDEIERAHELELARFEQDRTTDLVRRQQRYSDRSWVPPAQGGTVRAEDEESESG